MARPLTKRTKAGTLYARPPGIEANIDGALAQDLSTLVRRAEVADCASPDYLTSECLVHLIRVAIRRGDGVKHNTLLPILFARCGANLETTIRRNVPYADQLREDVLGELGVLFAEDAASESSGEMDYYECRFDSALSTLRFDVLRHEERKTKCLVPLSDGSGGIDESEVGRVDNVPPCRATQDDDLLWGELLEMLPADERKAVVLCEVMGYEVESKGPSKNSFQLWLQPDCVVWTRS